MSFSASETVPKVAEVGYRSVAERSRDSEIAEVICGSPAVLLSRLTR